MSAFKFGYDLNGYFKDTRWITESNSSDVRAKLGSTSYYNINMIKSHNFETIFDLKITAQDLTDKRIAEISEHIAGFTKSSCYLFQKCITMNYNIPDVLYVFRDEKSRDGIPTFKQKSCRPNFTVKAPGMEGSCDEINEEKYYKIIDTTQDFLINARLYENKLETVLANVQNRTPQLINQHL